MVVDELPQLVGNMRYGGRHWGMELKLQDRVLSRTQKGVEGDYGGRGGGRKGRWARQVQLRA